MTDKKSKTKFVGIGTSGTDIAGRRFAEEYLNKLLDTQAADTWDSMRRSDDQVNMLLSVVKNPIMTGRWFIEPVDDSEEAVMIADFITFVLFENMGFPDYPKTFEKFKREALTCLEFGYSLFEITNKVVFDHPKWGTYVGLSGLDWRSPRTIEEWYVSRFGVLEKVQQIDNSENGGTFFMPGKFLLHIAPNMEGDNYEGISALRPIYGNWLRKTVMQKIQMIGIERAATGVPIGTIPMGQVNSTSQELLEDSLSRFVSHQRSYITVPEGFQLDSLKIDHDAEKVQSAIESENKGMSKSFLANFMELGLSGGGSFALGTDLSDIFLSGITVYSNAILAPINSRLIPMLIDAKFGKQESYPKMKVEGINDKVGKEFAEVLSLLGSNGVLQVSNRLKSMVHQKYGLPEFQEEEEINTPEIDNNSLLMQETNVQAVVFDKSIYDTDTALNWLVDHGFKSDTEEDINGELVYKQRDEEEFTALKKTPIATGVNQVTGFLLVNQATGILGDLGPFEPANTMPNNSARNLQVDVSSLSDLKNEQVFKKGVGNGLKTADLGEQIGGESYDLAERGLSSIIRFLGKELAEEMADSMEERAALLVSDMLVIWRNKPKSTQLDAINRLNVPGKNQYKSDVCDSLYKTSIRATEQVTKELGTQNIRLATKKIEDEFNKLPSDTKTSINSLCDLIVATQDADLKKALFFSYTSKLDKLKSEAQMQANLNKVSAEYVKGTSIITAAGNAVTNTVNIARNAVYQKPEVLEKIESFIFRNSSPVAAICVELTGRVFTKEEYLTTTFLPPLHHLCDSWIEAQIKGEKGNKEITPIGLSVTGTEQQIETTLRSKKF